MLLFFLGVRNAMLVGIAIPLSMFISFLVFSVMGNTLNFIILFASSSRSGCSSTTRS